MMDPRPQVSDSVTKAAYASVGYTQLVSDLPIAPVAIPVIIVGAQVGVPKSQGYDSAVTLNQGGLFRSMWTVPAGKAWFVRKMWVNAATTGVLPAVLPATQTGAVLGQAVHLTACATNGIGTVYPVAAEAQPSGEPFLTLQAGDQLGVANWGGAASGALDAMVFYEEVNA